MIRCTRWSRRAAVLAGLTAVSTAAALGAVPAAQAGTAPVTFTFTRVAGPNRFATAATVATRAFPSGAPTAIVATGYNFPDALAGNYLAGQDAAPILLVNASGPVPAETLSALSTLKTASVTILGLQSAVGDDVAAQLANTKSTAAGGGNISVSRLGGQTRYDTARIVNETPGTAAVGTVNGKKTAFLARADAFPDALGAGPVAYSRKFPIILTDPNTLSPQASQTISALGIQQLLILGGTSAISSAVELAADVNGVTTLQRFAGATRSDTSRLVADYAITNFGFSPTAFTVASGDNQYGGADALASGPFSANKGPVPTLITNSVSNPGDVVTFAKEHAASETTGYAIGGPSPLPDATLAAISGAINNTPNAPVTSLPQLQAASIIATTSSGTTVRYLFSQDVSKAIIKAPGFLVYDANDGRFAAQSAAPVPGDVYTIDAFFGQTQADSGGSGTTPTNLQTTAGAAQLTLATVAGPQDTVKPQSGTTQAVTGPAVTLPTGSNPDASAPLGAAGSAGSANTAGVTAAPNPEAFSVVGAASGTTYANATAINVSFDKIAYAQTTAASVPTGYPATSTGGFNVVFTTTANTPSSVGPPPTSASSVNEESCYGPATSDATTPSGSTTPGGNGTTTLTIVCPDRTSGTPLTASDVSRVVVQPGAVGTGPAGATGTANVKNPLEVTDTRSTTSDSPMLQTVSFVPGTSTAADQIIYTFDRAVAGGGTGGYTVSNFGFYKADGTQTFCNAQLSNSGPYCTATQNANNFAQVVVTVGTTDGSTVSGGGATTNATGANVKAGAVTSASTPANANGDDEAGALSKSSAATQTSPGTVPAPQLAGVTVVTSTSSTGSTTTATYTFTEPVSSASPGGLHLYDADGTELTCNALPAPTTGTGSASNTVSCTSFGQSGGSAATATQLSGAVLGTVDYNTVTGSTANGAPNANPNPEGSANTH